jgi:hypothetical protein
MVPDRFLASELAIAIPGCRPLEPVRHTSSRIVEPEATAWSPASSNNPGKARGPRCTEGQGMLGMSSLEDQGKR